MIKTNPARSTSESTAMSTSWSRRQFMQIAAGTTALAGAPRWLRAAGDSSNAYGGLDVGLQSYTLREFPIDRVLQEIKNFGLRSIELFDANFSHKSSPSDIQAMKSKTAAAGVPMRGHGVNPFTKDHEANRRWFGVFCQGGRHSQYLGRSDRGLFRQPRQAGRGISNPHCHSQPPARHRYDKVSDVLTAIKGHHPLIGAVTDLGHYIRSAEDFQCESSICSKAGCTASI